MTTLAQGIIELKQHWKKTGSPLMKPSTPIPKTAAVPLPTSIQAFLDRFYMSRIGIRMLIGQHVSLSRASINHKASLPDYAGVICTKTNLTEVAQDAIDNARFVCQEYYGMWAGPEVKLVGKDNVIFKYVFRNEIFSIY